jgi:hypothetical protein
VLLWFLGLSFLITWQVFQSPAVDFRMVMLGAALPLVDVAVGSPTPLHTLVGGAAALGAVMVLARGRRLVQRRFVGIPIGMLLHLALDGTWSDGTVFWWPFLGTDLSGATVGVLDRPAWLLVLMELAGAAALLWCYRTFDLGDPARRDRFLRSGHLDRGLVRPPTC